MRVVMVGPFGLAPKQTMAGRALPMARALARRGHKVTLLLPPWSNPSASGICYDDGGVAVVNLTLPLQVPLFFQFALTLAMLRQTLLLRPDVVHCFKPKAYAGLVAWCLWWLTRLHFVRARLVVDADDWEGAGGWNAIEPYPRPLQRFFEWQEHWGLTHAHAVTVASDALQTLVWALGVPRASVTVVPNGASVSCAADVSLSAAANPAATILLYTRFFEFGLERIARLFELLGELHPALRITIVGQGLFGEEKQFARLLKGTRVDDKIRWLGWLPAPALPEVFARATLALFPFDDTLLNRTKCSIKLVDLLCAGVPVVAEAVGQNSDYIVNGESGLLVRSGDVRAMLEAVGRLLDDPSLRHKIGEGARRRMREQFSWNLLAVDVERAYTTITQVAR
jgi:glycosyltransferase involved in cell wall biosynthesis